jgi:DNA-binding transcriptional MerR regulator
MGKAQNPKFWRAGDLAKAAGVSTDTLRYYERKKVLSSQRSHNGYREYPEGALERVRMVRQAMAVGFTLDELGEILKVFDQGGAPCHQVRSLALKKLADVEEHLLEVKRLRNELREALKEWDARLARTTSGKRADLLKSFAASAGPRPVSSGLMMHKPKPKLKKKGKKDE